MYVGTDHNGRPMQRSRTFHGGARKAEDALRAFVHEVEQQPRTNRRAVDQTVGSLLGRWLEHLDATPYTKRSYRYTINASILPALGGVKLHKLSPHDLEVVVARKPPGRVDDDGDGSARQGTT